MQGQTSRDDNSGDSLLLNARAFLERNDSRRGFVCDPGYAAVQKGEVPLQILPAFSSPERDVDPSSGDIPQITEVDELFATLTPAVESVLRGEKKGVVFIGREAPPNHGVGFRRTWALLVHP